MLLRVSHEPRYMTAQGKWVRSGPITSTPLVVRLGVPLVQDTEVGNHDNKISSRYLWRF